MLEGPFRVSVRAVHKGFEALGPAQSDGFHDDVRQERFALCEAIEAKALAPEPRPSAEWQEDGGSLRRQLILHTSPLRGRLFHPFGIRPSRRPCAALRQRFLSFAIRCL